MESGSGTESSEDEKLLPIPTKAYVKNRGKRILKSFERKRGKRRLNRPTVDKKQMQLYDSATRNTRPEKKLKVGDIEGSDLNIGIGIVNNEEASNFSISNNYEYEYDDTELYQVLENREAQIEERSLTDDVPPQLERDGSKSKPSEYFHLHDEEDLELGQDFEDPRWPKTSTNTAFACNFCHEGRGIQQLTCLHVLCRFCLRRTKKEGKCPQCQKHNDNIQTKPGRTLKETNYQNIFFREDEKGSSFYYKVKPHTNFTKLDSRQKRRRVTEVQTLLRMLATGKLCMEDNAESNDSMREMKHFLQACLNRIQNRIRIGKFVELQKDNEILINNIDGSPAIPKQTQRKISEELEEAVRAKVDISCYQLRNLKHLLMFENLDILNSTNKQEMKFRESALGTVELIEQEIVLNEGTDDETEIHVIKVNDVKRAIEVYLEATKNYISSEGLSTDELQLKLSVDKGGGTTKICVCLLNRPEGRIESVFNHLLLGVYDGDDDAKTLRLAVPDLFAQFNSLEKVSIEGEEKSVKRVCIADLKAAAAIKGLVGPSSRRPCSYCEISADGLRMGKRGNSRTDEAAEKYGKKGASTLHNRGYLMKPLLEYNRTVYGFAALHVLQEPVTYFFKMLEDDVKKISTAIQLGERITSGTFESTTLDRYPGIERIRKDIKKMESALARLQAQSDNHITGPMTKTKCCGHCIAKKNEEGDWIQCNYCEKWNHLQCCGIMAREAKDAVFSCTDCDTDKDKLLHRLSCSIETENASISTFEAYERSKSHQMLKSFGSLCARYNVSMAAFHGGVLSGNHCHNFLSNKHHFLHWFEQLSKIDGIRELVESDVLKRRVEHYNKVLQPLSVLQSLAKTSTLTDDEIKRISTTTTLYGQNLQTYFPEYRFKPKTHELIFHLKELVEQEHSYGRYAEQGSESVHKQFNTIYAQFNNVGDVTTRLRRSMIYFNNRNLRLLCNKYALS